MMYVERDIRMEKVRSSCKCWVGSNLLGGLNYWRLWYCQNLSEGNGKRGFVMDACCVCCRGKNSGSCERDKEPLNFMKCGEFIDKPANIIRINGELQVVCRN